DRVNLTIQGIHERLASCCRLLFCFRFLQCRLTFFRKHSPAASKFCVLQIQHFTQTEKCLIWNDSLLPEFIKLLRCNLQPFHFDTVGSIAFSTASYSFLWRLSCSACSLAFCFATSDSLIKEPIESAAWSLAFENSFSDLTARLTVDTSTSRDRPATLSTI